MINWTTEKRKIGDLIPHPKNPRTVTRKKDNQLKDSLDDMGLFKPIVINTDNTILEGHQRVRILRSKYGKGHEVSVSVPERDLTDSECERILIVGNTHVGEWDIDIITAQFEVLDLIEWGIEDRDMGLSDGKAYDNRDLAPKEKTCPACGEIL